MCIEEESSGLDWENNQWNSVDWVLEKYIFKVTQDESLCKISKEGENQLCTSLTEFGNNTPLYLYYTYVNSASGSSIFGRHFKHFSMSDEGKFITTSTSPESVLDGIKNDLIVSAGSCSRI